LNPGGLESYGAPAPPVGLLGPDSALPDGGSEPPVALEPPLELSPPAELDPPVLAGGSWVAPLELSLSLSVPPADGSLALVLSSPVPSAVVEDFVVVAVVAVALVLVASLSAVVLLGGVISGVLRGTASATLLPPHAPSATPQAIKSTTALAAARLFPLEISVARCATPGPIRGVLEASSPVALTRPADPSAGRTSGSR
jgi:hypothetical protein